MKFLSIHEVSRKMTLSLIFNLHPWHLLERRISCQLLFLLRLLCEVLNSFHVRLELVWALLSTTSSSRQLLTPRWLVILILRRFLLCFGRGSALLRGGHARHYGARVAGTECGSIVHRLNPVDHPFTCIVGGILFLQLPADADLEACGGGECFSAASHVQIRSRCNSAIAHGLHFFQHALVVAWIRYPISEEGAAQWVGLPSECSLCSQVVWLALLVSSKDSERRYLRHALLHMSVRLEAWPQVSVELLSASFSAFQVCLSSGIVVMLIAELRVLGQGLRCSRPVLVKYFVFVLILLSGSLVLSWCHDSVIWSLYYTVHFKFKLIILNCNY